ncbi:hypothetical protein ACEN4P_08690 [Marinilactibacillus psychrotolerans]|uniref:Uncharacterized protein n=1 Tax=Marinilactibacillus psychrotolerans TaxID=191770 RepID=A0AAV3WVI1_9LACT|nr:hypothetical protein [Marinilactibacillus psychrotolerans]GEL67007.1 hypothetical protein MPS01_11620 [Marinilactibacillus psychrotolerans]GEQ36152.1 hypothetical protein M132T_16600 [Marinilactibacillus psychrotolerans]SDC75824.1 hypothetical protein SAMN04488013_10917 [Marinilactibacillus psychrotolerans]
MDKRYVFKGLTLLVWFALILYAYFYEGRFLQPVTISSIFVLILLGIKINEERQISKSANITRSRLEKTIDWLWLASIIFVSLDIVIASVLSIFF